MAEQEQGARIPLIGDRAPDFTAPSTQGDINFPSDYRGKWIVFFAHPADFTPVCTTEIMAFAAAEKEFRAMNAQLVGLSVDSTYSHIAWLRTIRERIEYDGISGVDVTFPIVSDLTLDVSRRYGLLHPEASTTQTVRAVFIIDPEQVVRAILYYPQSIGRNVDEIKRLLTALRRSHDHKVVIPANWRPGKPVIVPPPTSVDAAEDRVDKAGADYQCQDWFLCLRQDPEKKAA